MLDLTGVAVAAVTCFGEDGALDAEATAAQFDRLDHAGVSSILVGGNTGEFATLTGIELRTTYEVAAQTIRKTSVVCGVGGALWDAVELVGRAAFLEIAAV